jgi:nitrite reductase (NADH) small subunit
MTDWIRVCRIDDIPRLGARTMCTSEGRIAIFRTAQDHIYALADNCPHRNGPLSQGIVHGHRVTCPLHDWVIDLSTGQAVGPDEGSVATYVVRVDGDTVFVAPVRAKVEASVS